MSFFISDAIADVTTTSPAQPDGTFSLVMIAAIFILFYFILVRPQNKRAKEHRELIAKLKKGDEVVTTGGILGKIVSIDDQFIKISLAEGVSISIQRNAVNTILPKGTIKSL